MSIAETIAPHIPYLRRFARALTGSQSGGDGYDQATWKRVPSAVRLDLAVDRPATYRPVPGAWIEHLDFRRDGDPRGAEKGDADRGLSDDAETARACARAMEGSAARVAHAGLSEGGGRNCSTRPGARSKVVGHRRPDHRG